MFEIFSPIKPVPPAAADTFGGKRGMGLCK